ncbi:MAG: GerAB/ArcD/ProY family transporter [Thermaerobacter sp.]|nr:GerAB/ArcD/ProY family transporter [Thermaerobacter sp.]
MMNFSERHVITSRQLMYLLCIATFPTEVMLLPHPMITQFGKDALWAIAIASIYTVGPLLLSFEIVHRSKGRSLAHVLNAHGGLFGRLVLILFGLAILVPTINLWGGYVQLLHTALLARTPPWAILAVALAVVLYGVTGGLEVVGRLAELFVPVGIATIIGMWLLGLPWYNVGRLMPIWPQHPAVFTTGAYYVFTFLAEVVFGSYLGAFARDHEGVRRAMVLALVINTALLLMATAMPLLMFSVEHASMLTVPPLTAVRTIHFGFIIERLDTLIMSAWVIFVSLKLILWGLLAAEMIADALGVRAYALIGQISLSLTALFSLRLHSLGEVEASVVAIWYFLSFPAILLSVVSAAVTCRLRPRKKAIHA